MTMTIDELAILIGEGMGSVSMCWDPAPTGVFQSTMASQIVDEIMGEVNKIDVERQQAFAVIADLLPLPDEMPEEEKDRVIRRMMQGIAQHNHG